MKLPLEVLKDENAPALAVLAVITARFGTECYEWSAEYLTNEIENAYDITLTDLQSDKIQAAIIVMTTNEYENTWEAFETISHILNSTADSFHDLTPLEPEEIASAYAHYRLIKEGHEEEPFSDEINAYMGKVFYDYGFCQAPDLFPTALIPEITNECDVSEKNGALQEMFDARTKQIRDYMGKMILSTNT